MKRSRACSSAEALLAVLLLTCQVSYAATTSAERSRLTGERYPVEVSVSFSAALFHWLDSLVGMQAAGMSAGKTVAAHRRAFSATLGPMSERDREMLRRFADIRRRNGGSSDLLVTFLEAPDLTRAVERAASVLGRDDHVTLAEVIAHFAPKYARIWGDGSIPRRFLARCREDPALDDLETLLARIAAFLDVDPRQGETPHLVLTPVATGYGTHAQANGRHLLIEVRSVDRLATAASVIVHENGHLLMGRMPLERRQAFDARLAVWGPRAVRAANSLREALPTALGQGVADRAFRPREWSAEARWYHIEEIDRYAKRIYPVIEQALATKATFDETLLRRLIDLYPEDATPRSP